MLTLEEKIDQWIDFQEMPLPLREGLPDKMLREILSEVNSVLEPRPKSYGEERGITPRVRELLAHPSEDSWLELFEECVKFGERGEWKPTGGQLFHEYIRDHVLDWPVELRKFPYDIQDFFLGGSGFGTLEWVGELSIVGKLFTGDDFFAWMSHLPNLRRLRMSWCRGIRDLRGVEGCRDLESLRVKWCARLVDLEGVSELRKIRELSLDMCEALGNIDQLASMWSIENLMIEGGHSIEDFGVLGSLRSLQRLKLKGCSGFEDVELLLPLRKLKSLDLSNCFRLKDVSSLEQLTSLNYLNLSGCRRLVAGQIDDLRKALPECAVLFTPH